MTAKSAVDALKRSGRTLCTAESLTGGLLSAAVCDVPGASGCFLGGVAAYQDGVKTRMLGVSEDTLRRHSAVSAPCAREMARGARDRLGAHYALSTTGYAGPTGEDVGLVYIGLAGPGGVRAYRLRLAGSRQGIRKMTVQIALYILQKEIENHGKGKEHQERHPSGA